MCARNQLFSIAGCLDSCRSLSLFLIPCAVYISMLAYSPGCNVLTFALMLHADFACAQQLACPFAWTMTFFFNDQPGPLPFKYVLVCDGYLWFLKCDKILFVILEKVPHPTGFFFHLYSVFLCLYSQSNTLCFFSTVFSHLNTYQLLSMFFFTLTFDQINWTGATYFSPTHLVNKIIHTKTMDDLQKNNNNNEFIKWRLIY